MSCLWRATTHNLALSFVQVFKFRILQNGISANLGGSQMTLLAKNLPMPRGLNVDVTNLGPMPSWKSCLSCLRLVVQHFHFHPLCSNVVQNVSGICIMQWLEVCYLSSKRWSTGKKRQEDFFWKILKWEASLQGWVLCFLIWIQRSTLDSCWPLPRHPGKINDYYFPSYFEFI